MKYPTVIINGISVRVDSEGRYNLNDLHIAAISNGEATASQKPSKFIRSAQIKRFISALAKGRKCPLELRPMFKMTKDGFIFLVMGFTGKAAAQIKEAYINAFNWMAEQLIKMQHSYMKQHNDLMLEYMKEKDVASMSGRLLRRWGREKKPELKNRIEKLKQQSQIKLLI